MKRNVHRIIMLGAVLALVGALVISSAALAKGPDGAVQQQVQTRNQTQEKARTQTQTQAQVQLSSQERNGEGFGPGDGDCPLGGGRFGPGPFGNGTCDCKQ
jgi:hypothetical protein